MLAVRAATRPRAGSGGAAGAAAGGVRTGRARAVHQRWAIRARIGSPVTAYSGERAPPSVPASTAWTHAQEEGDGREPVRPEPPARGQQPGELRGDRREQERVHRHRADGDRRWPVLGEPRHEGAEPADLGVPVDGEQRDVEEQEAEREHRDHLVPTGTPASSRATPRYSGDGSGRSPVPPRTRAGDRRSRQALVPRPTAGCRPCGDRSRGSPGWSRRARRARRSPDADEDGDAHPHSARLPAGVKVTAHSVRGWVDGRCIAISQHPSMLFLRHGSPKRFHPPQVVCPNRSRYASPGTRSSAGRPAVSARALRRGGRQVLAAPR